MEIPNNEIEANIGQALQMLTPMAYYQHHWMEAQSCV
jgi:hypothetical protein